jgi:nicotinate-nucleotide--dimethylbenzimidazole phosphoribosyltransferase
MAPFTTIAELRACCLDLPQGDEAAAQAIARRERELTKPPGSLGRLEQLVQWLGEWQRRSPPRLHRAEILVFAGNHGVVAQGVSAYPAEVTSQMVANFTAGGAAINALAKTAQATLHVLPLLLEQPTADFTCEPSMDEKAFIAAAAAGFDAI